MNDYFKEKRVLDKMQAKTFDLVNKLTVQSRAEIESARFNEPSETGSASEKAKPEKISRPKSKKSAASSLLEANIYII